jgi:hypothetical protein
MVTGHREAIDFERQGNPSEQVSQKQTTPVQNPNHRHILPTIIARDPVRQLIKSRQDRGFVKENLLNVVRHEAKDHSPFEVPAQARIEQTESRT